MVRFTRVTRNSMLYVSICLSEFQIWHNPKRTQKFPLFALLLHSRSHFRSSVSFLLVSSSLSPPPPFIIRTIHYCYSRWTHFFCASVRSFIQARFINATALWSEWSELRPAVYYRLLSVMWASWVCIFEIRLAFLLSLNPHKLYCSGLLNLHVSCVERICCYHWCNLFITTELQLGWHTHYLV